MQTTLSITFAFTGGVSDVGHRFIRVQLAGGNRLDCIFTVGVPVQILATIRQQLHIFEIFLVRPD